MAGISGLGSPLATALAKIMNKRPPKKTLAQPTPPLPKLKPLSPPLDGLFDDETDVAGLLDELV